MRVRLIKHTPDPLRTVALAARLCYSPVGIEDIDKDLGDDDVAKLVGFIIKSGHLSTTEHISFNFAVEGISRAASHQVVRHRLASYNQQSQRYVRFKGDYEYITPPSIKEKDLEKKYKDVMEKTVSFYKDMLDEGIEAEDARYILPNAFETKMVITMNGRELLHFFTLRCCNRSQWEIREMSIEMLKLVKKACPIVFDNAGPNCLRGPCPEGKFKCDSPPKASDFDA